MSHILDDIQITNLDFEEVINEDVKELPHERQLDLFSSKTV